MKYLNLNQLSDKLGRRSRSSTYSDEEDKILPEPIRFGGRLYLVDGLVDEADRHKGVSDSADKKRRERLQCSRVVVGDQRNPDVRGLSGSTFGRFLQSHRWSWLPQHHWSRCHERNPSLNRR